MTSTKTTRPTLDLAGFTRTHEGILIPPGGRPEVASSFGQQAMQSSFIPKIYERYWRPLTFGVIAGGKLGRIDPRGAAASLELAGDAQVLDVACGPGNTTRPLLAHLGPHGQVIGLDASETMLIQAAAETADERVSYVLGDAAALPFADNTFDAVSCMAALYLMEEPYHAIAELVRVLRPGGRIALLASCKRGPAGVQPAVTAATKLSGIRMFDREELRERLILLGLADVRQEIHGMFQLVTAHLPTTTA